MSNTLVIHGYPMFFKNVMKKGINYLEKNKSASDIISSAKEFALFD